MRSFKVLAILALLAVDSISAVMAEVSHISIDTTPFQSGQLPQLTVNIITEHHDLSRLTFYLRQIYLDKIVLEKLDVERQYNDVFVLSGTQQIRDPDAALIVSEYRNAKWLQYSPVSIFSQAIVQSQYQPVAIKTMKSSSALPTSIPTSISSKVITSPQDAPTETLLNQCQIAKLPDDTLWKIAGRNSKQWNANIYGAMLALYQTNPSAFSQGKISLLQSGRSLRCPSAEILSRYQNVVVDKVTFDNLVASQRGKSQAVLTPVLPISSAVIAIEPASSHDSINSSDSQLSESEPLLAPIHKTQILPQLTSANDLAKTSLLTHSAEQAHEQDTLCVIERSPQDTLWRVASHYSGPWKINLYGAMLAIYDANPNAFANHKIYLLMSDSHLKCPSRLILKQYQNATKAQITYEALAQRKS
jgi:FimV-like protein